MLTTIELRPLLKRDSIVLWRHLCQDGTFEVEEGTVLFLTGNEVSLVWLEGYKSRNDTVSLEDVLSLHDLAAPNMAIFPFNGKGYLTETGQKWLQDNPRDN